MKNPLLPLVACAVLIAAGIGWYQSPYLALREMKSALDARDADAFNRHVDYPRLRDSLKAQLASALGAPPAAAGDHAAGQAGGAFASAFGQVLASGLVEALVRPELVMNAMRLGDFQVPGGSAPDVPPPGRPSAGQPADSHAEWTLDHEGLDTVVVRRAAAGQDGTGFILERHGLVDWKLAGVRLAARH